MGKNQDSSSQAATQTAPWPKALAKACEGAHGLAALSLAAGLYLTWWGAFHEAGRLYLHLLSSAIPYSGQASCLARTAGLCLGAALAYLLFRTPRDAAKLRRALPWFLGAQLLITVAFWYSIVGLRSPYAAVGLHLLASATVAPAATLWLVRLSRYPIRHVYLALLLCFGSYAVFSGLVFSCGLSLASPFVYGSVQAVFFASAVLLLRRSERLHDPLESTPRGAPTVSDQKGPAPLIAHLMLFGIVLGMTHALTAGFSHGASAELPILAGLLLAVVAFAISYLRKRSTDDVWPKIRAVAYPLAITGFLLLPVMREISAIPLSLTECALAYYNMLFALGCIVVIKNTDLVGTEVCAWGLFWKNLGMVAGSTAGFLLSGVLTSSSSAFSFASTAAFLALTAGAFWVGNAKTISKIWGLRRESTPRYHFDQVVHKKCELLREQHLLTARETEVLELLARGRRVEQITGDLGISIATTRTHVRNLYTKLDAHCAADIDALIRGIKIADADLD